MVYNFKDFTGQFLQDADFSGVTEIVRSCFSQEKPDTHVFPDDLSGVVFVDCNLDNVYIPPGNVTVNCSQRRFKAQDDGYDWLIDENDNPVERL